MLWINLDKLKPVNDRFGHAAGDGVLCELGQRFRACLRDADTVARLGGDEFVVVLDDLHSREDAYALADEIVAEAARPMAYGSIEIGVGASVGIAYWPEDGRDAAARFCSRPMRRCIRQRTPAGSAGKAWRQPDPKEGSLATNLAACLGLDLKIRFSEKTSACRAVPCYPPPWIR